MVVPAVATATTTTTARHRTCWRLQRKFPSWWTVIAGASYAALFVASFLIVTRLFDDDTHRPQGGDRPGHWHNLQAHVEQRRRRQQQQLVKSDTGVDNNHQLKKRSSLLQVRHRTDGGGRTTSSSSSSSSPSIAYAVTVTNCGNNAVADDPKHEHPFPITDGAAVLAYSIARAHANSRYAYTLYVIYHPEAQACAPHLADLGYVPLPRDTPVRVSEIRGDLLRSKIEHNGCCGEKELLKLEAYTLTSHDLVVMLDLDVLLLQPLDVLYDWLLLDIPPPDGHLQWPDASRTMAGHDIHLLFTYDYNMVPAGRRTKPMQGGFIVTRPNLTVYDEFCDIVREGDFRDRGGWGGKSGKYWGCMTMQGLLPYYYLYLHPDHYAIELNRCVFNNMASASRNGAIVDDHETGKCFTSGVEGGPCEICRERPIADIYTTHFTVCQKPWLCFRHLENDIYHRLCRAFHHAWFALRHEMETSWGRPGWGAGQNVRDRNHTFGYCHGFSETNYELIAQPYGQPAGEMAAAGY